MKERSGELTKGLEGWGKGRRGGGVKEEVGEEC